MARSRRLLVVAQPAVAGVPRQVVALVSGAVDRGWTVDVLCPRSSETWTELATTRGVTLHGFTSRSRPGLSDAPSWLRVLRLVRRADVIHAHSSKAGALVRAAAAVVGARQRVVFSPHGWSFWSVDGLEKRLYESVERRLARYCAVFVAVSVTERDLGLAAGVGSPSQYRIIPNGVDLDAFGECRPVPGRVVMVARMAPPKRHDLAIRALAILRMSLPNAELHLVGDGPRFDELVRSTHSLGVEGAVAFLGSRDDVPDQLASAACFLLATDYEAASLSVLEAMAAGVAIVATDVPSIREQLGDSGAGILAAPTPHALADAMRDVLSDPDRAVQMGAAGRDRVAARFRLDGMVRAVLALYDELLESSSTR